MSLRKAFHIGLTETDLNGARVAIIPGDPGRVPRIGRHLDSFEELVFLREFRSVLGELDGQPVVICSTGIGGPATSICVEELASLGIRTFLRIGTTGAIQERIAIGDIIISNASVRLDGASQHFAPLEFPAVSSFEVTTTLVEAARAEKARYHLGITASSDTFYPGQERYDTYTGRVAPRFRGSLEEWRNLGVLNYEMESATLFTMCQTMGLKVGCVAGVIASRARSEAIDELRAAETEEHVVRVGIRAARQLVAAAHAAESSS